ncbi:MAG: hypothetical protein K2H22_04755 [Muribaculaceae bacterium]|nr:hypothetical protein [Muribaculaceae bacterium]
MRQIILTLVILLFTLLPTGAANKLDIHPVKKIEANPINVAAMLTERPDSASVASTCEYYGYTLQSPQDGYTVFRHPNGSVIRFTFKEEKNGKRYSTIEVRSKASQKEKDQILQTLNFQKSGNAYVRRNIGYTTQCTNGPQGSLVFQQQPKIRN